MSQKERDMNPNKLMAWCEPWDHVGRAKHGNSILAFAKPTPPPKKNHCFPNLNHFKLQ